MMVTLRSGLSYFDLQFQGLPRVVATAVLHGPGGVALVDPGPSSTLPTLRAELESTGIEMADVTALIITHIHLDHAGAVGTLVREQPRLRVFVHEKGAPHMANPEKLLASATRLYGDAMDRLWGEVLPVPQAALTVLRGGERIEAGGRRLDVEYTPGHASHHVSYFSSDAGVAFVGDTAGIRRTATGFVMPPTPPPDIDLEAWRESLTRIDRWRAETLFVTHFGSYASAGAHLAELRDHLDLTSRLVKASLEREGTDESRAAWFSEEMRREIRRQMSDADAEGYEAAGPFNLNWGGLARYWRKKNGI
jgi:glyoxylase-like metal-dependent hydrolase (beta-lactamase superfamily II)